MHFLLQARKIKFKISSKLLTINFSSEDGIFKNKIIKFKQESQREVSLTI